MTRTTTSSAHSAITTIDGAQVRPTIAGPTTCAPGPIELMLDSLETALAHLRAIDDGAVPTETERARAQDLWAPRRARRGPGGGLHALGMVGRGRRPWPRCPAAVVAMAERAPHHRARPDGPDMAAAALGYAERGWAVFPVATMMGDRCGYARACDRPAKHPLTRHGLHDATTDAPTVRGWWARHPGADIGVATGASGMVVIDVDAPDGEGSLARLDALGLRPEPTLTALTGGGGRHLVYAAGTTELHNTAGGLPGVGEALPGIDLRAQGGYIIAPPSVHASGARCRWEGPARALVPVPRWLHQVEVPVARPQPRAALGPLPTTGGTRYGLAALQDELATLGGAVPTTRNHQLNRSAFALGRLCAGAQLDAELAMGELTRVASSSGLGPGETAATIASGMTAGGRYPRVLSPSAPPRSATPCPKLGERNDLSAVGPGQASATPAPAPPTPSDQALAPSGAHQRHGLHAQLLARPEQPPVVQP